MFAFCSEFRYIGNVVTDDFEPSQFRESSEAPSPGNTAFPELSFRGSKAEALMALEYDRIPNFMKTTRAIAFQRKLATAVVIIVPLVLLAIVVIGGINAYRDRQRSAELRQLDGALERDFQPKPLPR